MEPMTALEKFLKKRQTPAPATQAPTSGAKQVAGFFKSR